MKKIIFLSVILFSLVITSCEYLHDVNQPDEPAIEYSSIWPLSGEWYVKYRFDDGSGDIDDHYGVGYVPLFTYNTSDNEGESFWINDDGNFWAFTVKCPCDVSAKSFSGTDLISTADWDGSPYDIAVDVTNGKVIEGGGKSDSGVTTDSIYFEVEFEDDPGTIYQVSGIRRTGFLEDEH